MSGECECGEHALECGCLKHKARPNDKFYYQGKFFEKEEEFWAYVKDFSIRQTNAQDFDGLFDMLKKDVWMNIVIRENKISNSEVQAILDESFLVIMEKIWTRLKE